MKKRYIALLALLVPTMLVSCGDKNKGGHTPSGPGVEDKLPATFTLPTSEHFQVTSTLDGKTGLMSGDKGVLNFVMSKGWHIISVLQNDFVPLFADPNDKNAYLFELMEGENTFEVSLEEKIDQFSENGLLEGPDNSVNKGGTLTDSVDPKPTPGAIPEETLPEIEKPTYANGKDIYLYTKDWWDTDGSFTGITCYDKNQAKINTPRNWGVVMEELAVKDGYKVLTWVVDADNTKFVSFSRTNKDGTKDYNARTDILPVPDFTTNNAYEISNTSAWYTESGYADAKLVKYSEDYKPDVPNYNDGKTIFFQDAEWWNKDSAQTFIACFNDQKQIINVPNIKGEDGVAMTHIKYDGTTKCNTWSYKFPENAKYFRFKRYSQDGSSYWGAYTDMVGLPDFPTHNGYKVNCDGKWDGAVTTLEVVSIKK